MQIPLPDDTLLPKGKLDIGVATRPKRGESSNGDAHLIKQVDGTLWLVVIDGLGHGEYANDAASHALAFLETHFNLDMVTMIKGCHDALRNTRGAVLSIISIHENSNTLSYTGIGNIDTRLLGERELHLTAMGGIVGHNLVKTKVFEYPYKPGDTIVMFSDGISSRIELSEFLPTRDLQRTAERILAEQSRDDDATILLAKAFS